MRTLPEEIDELTSRAKYIEEKPRHRDNTRLLDSAKVLHANKPDRSVQNF